MTTGPAAIRRVVFLGTPTEAVPPLRALHAAGFDIGLAVTGADRRRGRGGATSPSPVKAAALELGIPVSHEIDDVVELDAQLGVVVAFGRLIRPHVLERLPMVNLHFSLLPRWRGAAPVERAILAGDDLTGVCVMAVEEGLDTGGVYRQAEVRIEPSVTADELRAELVVIGTKLLVETLTDGLGEPEPQRGEPTYAHKLEPAEFELDWGRPAVELHRWIRVGGAWTVTRGRRLKIWAADIVEASGLEPAEVSGLTVGAGEGGLLLRTVQPEGSQRMDAEAWHNGAQLEPGDRLGAE